MPSFIHSFIYNKSRKHTQPHAYAYGGAPQLKVGSFPVSVSRPLALHCYLCLTHCSPGNVPNPTPRTLDEYTSRQYWYKFRRGWGRKKRAAERAVSE